MKVYGPESAPLREFKHKTKQERKLEKIKKKVEIFGANVPVKSGFRKKIRKMQKFQAIQKLRDYTSVVIENTKNYHLRRKIFNINKWKQFKQWQICFACKSSPIQHIHHIIMLKNGGTNQNKNLIGLCEECHCLIHDWMKPKIMSQEQMVVA